MNNSTNAILSLAFTAFVSSALFASGTVRTNPPGCDPVVEDCGCPGRQVSADCIKVAVGLGETTPCETMGSDPMVTLVRILRLVSVVVLPVVIVFFALQAPFWSFQSPDAWDRPRFIYGWFLPWKGEPAMWGVHMICPFLNLVLWTLYLMVLVGYRRIRHYLVMFGMMLVLFGLYAKLVGIETIYRERERKSAKISKAWNSEVASLTPGAWVW